MKKYLCDISFVQVSYQMDFELFGYKTPGTGAYPPESLSLFARHALDLSIKNQIQITFNGCNL